MLFTYYHYHSNRNTNTVLFVKEKDIINVYVNLNYEDYTGIPLLVITEENMKNYPILYKIYIVSLMLTEDPSNLNIDEDGHYGIRKKTIWKNLYITDNYDFEMSISHIIRYPKMFYNLSTDTQIEYNMYTIKNNIVMINDDLLCQLIRDEINNLEKQLSSCEDYSCKVMYSHYIKNILPDNIPIDLGQLILEQI